MLAVAAPTRSRPSRNVMTGRTVETITMPAMSSQPWAERLTVRPPWTSPVSQNVAAAPVAIIALSRNGSIFETTVSATRMYVEYAMAAAGDHTTPTVSRAPAAAAAARTRAVAARERQGGELAT